MAARSLVGWFALALGGLAALAVLASPPAAAANPCGTLDPYPIVAVDEDPSRPDDLLLAPSPYGGLGAVVGDACPHPFTGLSANGGTELAFRNADTRYEAAGGLVPEWMVSYAVAGTVRSAGSATAGLAPMVPVASSWEEGCGGGMACHTATITTRTADGALEVTERYRESSRVPGLMMVDMTFTNTGAVELGRLTFRHQVPYTMGESIRALSVEAYEDDWGASLSLRGSQLGVFNPLLYSANSRDTLPPHALSPELGHSTSSGCPERTLGPGAYSGGVPFTGVGPCPEQWGQFEAFANILEPGAKVHATIAFGFAKTAAGDVHARGKVVAAQGHMSSIGTPPEGLLVTPPTAFAAYDFHGEWGPIGDPTWAVEFFTGSAPCMGLPGTFTNTYSPSHYTWVRWNWGDGTSTKAAPGEPVTHTYTTPGPFTVSVDRRLPNGVILPSNWAKDFGTLQVEAAAPPACLDPSAHLTGGLTSGCTASRAHVVPAVMDLPPGAHPATLDFDDGTILQLDANHLSPDGYVHDYNGIRSPTVRFAVEMGAGRPPLEASLRLAGIEDGCSPPSVTAPASLQVVLGTPLAFAVSASDPDFGDTLVLTATAAPDGFEFGAASGPGTGLVSWAAWTPSRLGTFTATFEARDEDGQSATTTTAVEVVRPRLGSPDRDNDGVSDAADNCPGSVNLEQGDTDHDGQGDACDIPRGALAPSPLADLDRDGVEDGADNCPVTPNSGQADLDADRVGDACDPDVDGDGVLQAFDNCPLTPNPRQENADGDLAGDACDAVSLPDRLQDAARAPAVAEDREVAAVKAPARLPKAALGVVGGIGLVAIPFALARQFSRVADGELAQNPVRRAFLDLVDAQPGITQQALASALGKGRTAIDHHGQKMLKAGLVRQVRQGGQICYYPARAVAIVSVPDRGEEVLEHVRRNPGQSLAEIARLMGTSPGAVHHHLRRLESQGRVHLAKDGRRLLATVVEPAAAKAA